MAVETSLVADSKVEIGGTIVTADLASFEDAGRTYIEIGGVTDIGEFGDEREIATIKLISEGRTRKKPGTADAGDMQLTVARDSLDPGQIALRAAAKTKHAYAIKITDNDAPEGGTPTVNYLKAYVSSVKNQKGEADNFNLTVFTFAIDAAPLIVEAEAE